MCYRFGILGMVGTLLLNLFGEVSGLPNFFSSVGLEGGLEPPPSFLISSDSCCLIAFKTSTTMVLSSVVKHATA